MRLNRLIPLILATVFLVVGPSNAQQKQGYTIKEISARIDSVSPDPDDFQFDKPSGWSSNLARSARVSAANHSAESDSLRKINDGRPASSWESKKYDPRPELVLDFGKTTTLSKLAVFNTHTDARGTAGGNNAVSNIEVRVSQRAEGTAYRTIGQYEIDGPKEVCFRRKGGGKVCTFIPRTEPSVVDLDETQARRVKLILKEAHWGKAALPSWKSSAALSEVMLYQTVE